MRNDAVVRTGNKKIIVHYIVTYNTVTVCHKLKLVRTGMNQKHIRISVTSHSQSRTAANSDNINFPPCFIGKHRQKEIEQSRILSTCGC
jgi:hypothetical protein